MVEVIQLQLLLATFAGWVTRQQVQVISKLIEENRLLKEQLLARGRSMQLTDRQRRRLAAGGKPLGHKLLSKIVTIVTPDTIMAWYRGLIASKWKYPRTKVCRPGVMKEIRKLIVRMAEKNPSWGYCRIQGGLKSLDHQVARSTIAKVLKEHVIAPAPGRPSSWRTFIKSHAAVIAAADVFTTEVWTTRGLVTHYAVFVIDIATRRGHIAGTTTNPASAWMAQAARKLTDCVDGLLKGKRYMIVNRDALFSEQFKAILRSGGTKIVHKSIQAPNMNVFAERFVLSIRSECLDRMIFAGRDSLERAIRSFSIDYHGSRTHLGLEKGCPVRREVEPPAFGGICSEAMVGELHHRYFRRAA